jgi:hypothetical protein
VSLAPEKRTSVSFPGSQVRWLLLHVERQGERVIQATNHHHAASPEPGRGAPTHLNAPYKLVENSNILNWGSWMQQIVQLLVLDIYACPCHTAALPSSTTFAQSIKQTPPEKKLSRTFGHSAAPGRHIRIVSTADPAVRFSSFCTLPLLARRPTPRSVRHCCPPELGRRESIPSTSLQPWCGGGVWMCGRG